MTKVIYHPNKSGHGWKKSKAKTKIYGKNTFCLVQGCNAEWTGLLTKCYECDALCPFLTSCTTCFCLDPLLLYRCTLSRSTTLVLLYSVQFTSSCTTVLCPVVLLYSVQFCPVHLLIYFTLYFSLAAAGAADQSGSSGISPKLTLAQLDTS